MRKRESIYIAIYILYVYIDWINIGCEGTAGCPWLKNSTGLHYAPG